MAAEEIVSGVYGIAMAYVSAFIIDREDRLGLACLGRPRA